MGLWHRVPKSLRRVLYWSPTAICLAHTVSVKQISGRSMQPTLNPDSSIWKDIAFFDRITPHILRPCQRGDIVAVRSPVDPTRLLVKRIVALEGDVVKTRPPCAEPEVQVPVGHLWIEGEDENDLEVWLTRWKRLGDEPFRTDDSNLFGPVPAGLVESRLVALIWPFHRFGRLSIDVPEDKTMPAYRLAMDQIQREHSRRSRVTIAAKLRASG